MLALNNNNSGVYFGNCYPGLKKSKLHTDLNQPLSTLTQKSAKIISFIVEL